jgi:hypothetical protein
MTDKPDPLILTILDLAEAAGAVGIAPQDIAKSFFAARQKANDPADGWRKYLKPVKQQCVALARANRVEIVRKRGEVVDPNDFRGLVKVRLPRDGEEATPTE